MTLFMAVVLVYHSSCLCWSCDDLCRSVDQLQSTLFYLLDRATAHACSWALHPATGPTIHLYWFSAPSLSGACCHIQFWSVTLCIQIQT